ncbi:MAG: hypothetical protein EAZ53_04615 [Bacteroidetes bacterium]|nr:MAG: hypothetical protein EAZ53_04615 [Bacteroidota bacterium]
MNFYLDDNLLPSDFTKTNKDRLREALNQFKVNNNSDKNYTNFFSSRKYSYFLQGDVIRDVRFPRFDFTKRTYSKEYFDCILLSNTCDMDENNNRQIKKEILICKLILFDDYKKVLLNLKPNNFNQIISDIKSQQFSNIFYLPPNSLNKDYIVFLDEIHNISIEELKMLKIDIDKNRISTLDFFGYYLFIFKLSYHFCRMPEVSHR